MRTSFVNDGDVEMNDLVPGADIRQQCSSRCLDDVLVGLAWWLGWSKRRKCSTRNENAMRLEICGKERNKRGLFDFAESSTSDESFSQKPERQKPF